MSTGSGKDGVRTLVFTHTSVLVERVQVPASPQYWNVFSLFILGERRTRGLGSSRTWTGCALIHPLPDPGEAAGGAGGGQAEGRGGEARRGGEAEGGGGEGEAGGGRLNACTTTVVGELTQEGSEGGDHATCQTMIQKRKLRTSKIPCIPGV